MKKKTLFPNMGTMHRYNAGKARGIEGLQDHIIQGRFPISLKDHKRDSF